MLLPADFAQPEAIREAPKTKPLAAEQGESSEMMSRRYQAKNRFPESPPDTTEMGPSESSRNAVCRPAGGTTPAGRQIMQQMISTLRRTPGLPRRPTSVTQR